MATWRKTEGAGMNKKTVGKAPKQTPKSYETHPGNFGVTAPKPHTRPVKGFNRKTGLGAKNPDGRAKM